MAAWWIYGDDHLGVRWFEYVPATKCDAYRHIRLLTDTQSSFNGGRTIANGAYEFSTHETRERGQRWFIFTLAGAKHLLEPGKPVETLLKDIRTRAGSPLKEQLRAV